MNVIEQMRARKKALEDAMYAMDEDEVKKVPGVTISIEAGKPVGDVMAGGMMGEEDDLEDMDPRLAEVIRKKRASSR